MTKEIAVREINNLLSSITTNRKNDNSFLPAKTNGEEIPVSGDIRDYSEEQQQELESVESSATIGGDANDSDIQIESNNQNIGNATTSRVTGVNINGSNNQTLSGDNSQISNQTNTVTINNGITGITGSGHTINSYTVDLKMLIELIKGMV